MNATDAGARAGATRTHDPSNPTHQNPRSGPADVAVCAANCGREAPIGARLLLIGIILAALTGAVAAEPAARVVSVRFVGEPLEGADPILDTLLGRPATAAEIVALLRTLEQIPRAGAFDVAIEAADGRASLRVIHTAGVRHVGDIAVQVDGEDLGLARSRALLRRVDVREAIALGGGRRFHPYMFTADRDALTRWYVGRGYRDVTLGAVVGGHDDLVDVGWQVARGARYEYTEPQLTGLPRRSRAAIRRGLKIGAGGVASASDLTAERARIEARLCADGYPRAQVTAREVVGAATTEGVRPVTVELVAISGPRIVTGAVQVAGRYVPQILLATLPLIERGPYCPDLEDAARLRLEEYLRDTGVPNPEITVHRRTRLQPSGLRVVAVTFDVRELVAARVEKIWFVGNEITQARVLRQLTAISEGDGYRQSLVDESVQAMRRSGLFRRVSVDIIAGRRADRVSLRFRVSERVPFRVDPVARSVTLYNLDLADWPEDSVDVSEGFAFRGGGQRLDLYGQTESLGFRWRHGFLDRYLLSTVGFRYSTAETAAFEETWISGDVGLGLKTATNSLSAMLITELIWHTSTRIEGSSLAVLDGDAFAGALALQLAFDLTRRDDERISYAGIEGRATVRIGTALAGEPIRWADDVARVTLHLPLWRTERGQHWVLRFGARNRSVVSLGEADLPGHLRQRPSARGYAADAIGVLVAGPDSSELLGALHTADGTIELRIPLPIGRRNGISPFLDAATAADKASALLDDVHTAVGVALSFSFLQERIEGVVWGAWPLDEDAEASRVGGSFGGSF